LRGQFCVIVTQLNRSWDEQEMYE